MTYSSRPETEQHREMVGGFIHQIIGILELRKYKHDASKLYTPEVELFDIFTPKLAGCTYGSKEYKQYLAELKPALDHHYRKNRHHPEHFEDGILGMNLVDLVEMFCDWYAATKRHNDGNILKSIEINQKRFGYSDDLKAIFANTFHDLFEKVNV
jgi:hypothetical protein